jgi:phage/plasmid-like protein (TIGR03299 family)
MAHNLYRNTLAFVGQRPWHKLGVQFDQAFTSAEAIAAARLDYPVLKEQLYRLRSDLCTGMTEPTAAYATINGHTQDVLGIVGDGYEVLQNREAFDFFDILLKESGGKLQTAGAIGKGEKVWMLAKLPEVFYPIAGDGVEKYLLGTTSHDGTMKTEVRFSSIRVVCQNTFNLAMKNSRGVISIRHTTNMRQKLEMAAMVMLRYKEHFDLVGEQFGKLASVRIDDAWIDEYLLRLIGNPENVADGRGRTIMENKIKLIEGRLAFGKGVDLPGVANSAWWALNAMVEFADFDMKAKGQAADESRRTQSILFGTAAEFKQQAFDTAMAMVTR